MQGWWALAATVMPITCTVPIGPGVGCLLCRYGESRLASGPIDTKFAQMFEVSLCVLSVAQIQALSKTCRTQPCLLCWAMPLQTCSVLKSSGHGSMAFWLCCAGLVL